MSRSVQSFLSIVLIAAVGLPVWHFVVAARSEPPPAPPRDVGPASVNVRRLEAVDFPIVVEAYGTLVPVRTARLAPEQSGRVTWVRPDWAPRSFCKIRCSGTSWRFRRYHRRLH